MDFDEAITDERKHSRERDLHVAEVSCLSFCSIYSGKQNRKITGGILVTAQFFLSCAFVHPLCAWCCTKQKTASALKGLRPEQTRSRFLTSVG